MAINGRTIHSAATAAIVDCNFLHKSRNTGVDDREATLTRLE